MNLFFTLLQADWTERIGWTLLHSVWQITLISALYAIVSQFLRNRSAIVRYNLGSMALLAMIGIPLATFFNVPATNTTPPTTLNHASTHDVTPPPVLTTSLRQPEETLTAPHPPTESSLAFVSTPTATRTTHQIERRFDDRFQSALQPWLPCLSLLWLGGSFLFLIRPVWGWFHVQRLQRLGLSPLSDSNRQLGQRMALRLKVTQTVQMLQSSLVQVPTVVGYLKPMILLPASTLTGLPADELELVLAHELAHIRRHDYLLNFAQTLIESALFYHPAMWWVSRQVRHEREHCCDDMVVALDDNRIAYVQALARLEEQRQDSSVVLAASGGFLLKRIRRLLGQPTSQFENFQGASCLAGVSSLCAFILLACLVIVSKGDEPDNSTSLEANRQSLEQDGDTRHASVLPDDVPLYDPEEEDQAVDDTVLHRVPEEETQEVVSASRADAEKDDEVILELVLSPSVAKGQPSESLMYVLDGNKVAPDELRKQLETNVKNDPEFKLAIRAEKQVPAEKIARLLVLIEVTGVKRVNLNTSKLYWGDSVDGVRVRLTSVSRVLGRSDWPHAVLQMKYDVINQGKYHLHLPENGMYHQIEVDGQWYERVSPPHSSDDDRQPVPNTTELLDLKPQTILEGQEIQIAGNWMAIPEGKEQQKANQRSLWNSTTMTLDDYGKELVLTEGQHVIRIAVVCPSAREPFHGVVRTVSKSLPVNIGEVVIQRDSTSPTTQSRARQGFLLIERFARLSQKKQAEQLPQFYAVLPARSVNPMAVMILSSYPHNILDPGQGPYDGNTELWGHQLAEASATLSVEQVADKIESPLWMNVASRARAIQTLKNHPRAVSVLIKEGLNSGDSQQVAKSTTMIDALQLSDFAPKLLEMLVANDEFSQLAHTALVFLKEAEIVEPLLKHIKVDPKFLSRCAGLFQGPLHQEPAPPVLLILTESSDEEIRYQAGYALMECRDQQLVDVIQRFSQEEQPRLRWLAVKMASRQPEADFLDVRKNLLPLLDGKGNDVSLSALRCFSRQKDLAAAPILLGMLKRTDLNEQQKITVMQSMSALSGSTWNYDLHNWGPEKAGNIKAIEQFENWFRKKQESVDTKAI